MDTLLLTGSSHVTDDAVLKVKPVSADHLFFDRYQYSVRFFARDLSCIRGTYQCPNDLPTLFTKINTRLQNRQTRRNWIDKSTVYSPDDLLEKKLDLYNLAVFLQHNLADTKLVIYGNWGYVYANQLTVLQQLTTLSGLSDFSPVRQIKVDRAKNSVALKKSDYQYRSFFTTRKLTSDGRDQLVNWLQAQTDIRLSPGLTNWCGPPELQSGYLFNHARQFGHLFELFTERYHFIDHNDISLLTMLSLLQPGIIRKTINIVVVNTAGGNHGKNIRRSCNHQAVQTGQG